MKKSFIFFLAAIGILFITACGTKPAVNKPSVLPPAQTQTENQTSAQDNCENLAKAPNMNEVDFVRTKIACHLKAGSVDALVPYFQPGKKVDGVFPILKQNPVKREELSLWIEKATVQDSDDDGASYRYSWTDDDGEETFVDFALSKNFQGQWIITNW